MGVDPCGIHVPDFNALAREGYFLELAATTPAAACAQVEDYFRQTWIDVALVIGTEATFSYIGDWALRAKRSGSLLVEINPSPTVLTPFTDVRLEGKAGEILKEVGKGLSFNRAR